MTNPVINGNGTTIRSMEWYNDVGQFHRLDGPAVVWSDGYKAWYINGKIHREDGPAIMYSNGEKSYWLNDKRYSQDAYKMIQFFNGVNVND